jgi:hypothetical protein
VRTVRRPPSKLRDGVEESLPHRMGPRPASCGELNSAIILPNRVIGGWWCKEGHALHPEDLEAVLEAAPEVLVVGQGAYDRMRVTEETEKALQDAGIELIALPTGQAVEAYNRLRDERAVAAALHLTC